MTDEVGELPAHVVEDVRRKEEMVRQLCELAGYGFVMGSAARQWAKIDPLGAFTVGEPVGLRRTADQQAAIDGPAPDGYGPILHSDGDEMPEWLDPEEIVARHLPMGLSERKAEFVVTWDHPFRVRADHLHYSKA